MTTLYLIAMALPLCIANVLEAGNIGSSSGIVVTVPTAVRDVELQADLSAPNYTEAWVFW